MAGLADNFRRAFGRSEEEEKRIEAEPAPPAEAPKNPFNKKTQPARWRMWQRRNGQTTDSNN